MIYVNRIIYTKPDIKDIIDKGNNVNVDFPEGEKSNDINKREHNDVDEDEKEFYLSAF